MRRKHYRPFWTKFDDVANRSRPRYEFRITYRGKKGVEIAWLTSNFQYAVSICDQLKLNPSWIEQRTEEKGNWCWKRIVERKGVLRE